MPESKTPTSEYARWLSSDSVGGALRAELLGIAGDEAAIADRFWRDLSFGTGGLRGIMGAGTNRMNELVVRRATQGLAEYIKARAGGACGGEARSNPARGGKNGGGKRFGGEERGGRAYGDGGDGARGGKDRCGNGNGGGRAAVCIAYDTRNMSRQFAEIAAETLCGNGIAVHLFTGPRPTPMLSFAVREKRALAGVVITASHNPREYSGYKVYGADGGQITDAAAKEIAARIGESGYFGCHPRLGIAESRKRGLLFDLDAVDSAYYENVKSLVVRRALVPGKASELSILYSPLHGAGNIPVRRVLGELGFARLSVVPEQEPPDGDFPTVRAPNPEDGAAFGLALKRAKENPVDIILATDPDCDRIGVRARSRSGGYEALSGNQIGALLCDYMIAGKKESGELGSRAAVAKTIVTTELARKICAGNGVAIFDTLTGFKYIGEKIGEWERTGGHSFLLGFEESCGYLAGSFVRDKDAVIAAALICEMALFHKLNGDTLCDALEGIYLKYGFADERLVSVALGGRDGNGRISRIMSDFRKNPAAALPGQIIAGVDDYIGGLNGLPKADALKFRFGDESWLAVRPSGTEPKIKFYFGAAGRSRADVAARLHEIERIVRAGVRELG